MAKNFFEAIIASGGFAGEEYDVNAGPLETGIIDALLAGGAPVTGILTIDAPLVLKTAGDLLAAHTLNIAGIEQDGRFFILAIESSDIAAFNLTVTATTDINGGGTSFVINKVSFWLFVHTTAGTWFAFEQSQSVAAAAGVFRVDIAGADWTGGTNDSITVLQTGAPAAGEVGPHGLGINDSFTVQVFDDTGTPKMVDVEVEVLAASGNVVLTKSPSAPDFAGTVIIIG